MVVYFSGTGNSRHCAELLAQKLGDECVDSFHFIRDGIAAELITAKPWVFVAPTYAWRLPRAFAQFIRSGSFAGSGDAWFVMTCGSEPGDDRYNAALCAEKGLRYRGTLPVVMPDNYIVLFPSPKPEVSARQLAAVPALLEEAAGRIAAGQDFPALKVGWADRLKSGLVNEGFNRYFVRSKKFTVSDACVGCGKCGQLCPLGGIHMEEGRPVWEGDCTHCMACISFCPTQAIEYGRSTRGKARYRGPAAGE